MTQQEFNQMFIVAMSQYGKAQENSSDVPTVQASTLINSELYSLPMIKNNNGVLSYAKTPVSGNNGLIQAIADEVETEGMLQSITEAEFNAIFT